MTAQVATVRHRTSVPAKFQIASRQATTATRIHPLVVQNEILVTIRGLRKPLRNFFSGSKRVISARRYSDVTGAIDKSARTGPSGVTAIIRRGR
ncbi:MAG: hypothetical protein QOK48_1960 [Blastocatellia bacterium]|nr:hypothetical protein [Blastocatellia bacterium]